MPLLFRYKDSNPGDALVNGGCDGCLNLQGAMFVPPELLKIENDSDDGNGDKESVSSSCI